MTEELKPCPFCGGEATIYISLISGREYVGCDDCSIDFEKDTKQQAIDAWNRRPKDDE